MPLIMAACFIAIGLISFVEAAWRSYGFFSMGAMGLGMYLHRRMNPYITIEENRIQINTVFPERFFEREICYISKFSDQYTIHTKNKKHTIATNIIDKDSLVELEHYLQQFRR